MLALAREGVTYAEVDATGTTTQDEAGWRHVAHVLDLALVDAEAIRGAGLKVAVDAVNSSGGVAVPMLLKPWAWTWFLCTASPPDVSHTTRSRCPAT